MSAEINENPKTSPNPTMMNNESDLSSSNRHVHDSLAVSNIPSLPESTMPSDINAETAMNMTLFDPPRWGWTAVGGITDVLSPHERSRRRSTCQAYRKQVQQHRRRRSSIGTMYSRVSSGNNNRDNASHHYNPNNNINKFPIHQSSGKSWPQQQTLYPQEPQQPQQVLKAVDIAQQMMETTSRSSQNLGIQQQWSQDSKKDSISQNTVSTLNKFTSTDDEKPVGDVKGTTTYLQNQQKPLQPAADTSKEPVEVAHTESTIDLSEKQSEKASIDQIDGYITTRLILQQQQSPASTMCTNETQVQILLKNGKNQQKATSAVSEVIQPKVAVAAVQSSTPEIDMGVKVMGVPSSILGMTILRQVQKDDNKNGSNSTEVNAKDDNKVTRTNDVESTKTKKTRRPGGIPKYDCTVHSLGESDEKLLLENDIALKLRKSAKILDMYAYHRGREGMEARDAESGELLCVQEVTDTNHELDAPKLVVPIAIQFLLEDHDMNASMEIKEGPNLATSKAMFRDVIQWDLSDLSTPSPVAFATNIAHEYGLSFGATMDLAASVEQQIDAHIASHCQYIEPVTVKDPQGLSDRSRQFGPSVQVFRYDQVIETGKGGHSKPRKLRVPTKSRSTTSGGLIRKSKSISEVDGNAGNSSATHTKLRGSVDSAASVSLTEPINTEHDNEIEKIYVDEAKKRSRIASILDIGRKCINGTVGKLERLRDSHCHICHKRCQVGYCFACDSKNHVYCEYHMRTRLGLTEFNAFEYCPICSLICECAKCTRKMNTVAKLLKAKCLEQEKDPSKVNFPDILNVCVQKQPNLIKEMSKAAAVVLRRKKEEELQKYGSQKEVPVKERKVTGGAVQQRTCQNRGQTMVPKPPLKDFPREIYMDKELEVATARDYFTKFSTEGQQLVSEIPDAWLEDSFDFLTPEVPLTKEAEVPEDGNVDYCHYCRKPGNLVCCDFCPRAFHLLCMKEKNQASSPDERWECNVCKKEKAGSDEDIVDGKKSMDLIISSFLNLDVCDESAMRGIEVLSKVHDMLNKLMVYDFGYIFCEPVDLATTPGYKEMIKRPMDLGTICSMLINGDYAKLLDGSTTMDDVVAEVLRDIELVWHNCFTYNLEGSSFFRMADVLRRRASMIRRRSFNDKLSARVQKEVDDFVALTERERAAMPRGTAPRLAGNDPQLQIMDEVTLSTKKPKSKYQFSVSVWKPKASKSIAVLDPVSGRIVKAYGTAKTAANAVQILLKLGHRCEWNAKLGINMKLVAEKSAKDPSSLLFGYRWVFLDDLRAGEVLFNKPSCDLIEMRHGQCTYVFQSIEEALSFSDLPKGQNLSDLRKKLNVLHKVGDWVEICGIMWRRPEVIDSKRMKYSGTYNDGGQNPNATVHVASLSSAMATNVDGSSARWTKSAIVKKDLVTNRILVGFEYVSLAYKDWMQTTFSSPTFPESEPRTIQNFKKYYLHGDRNIDGIIWRTPLEVKNATKALDAAHVEMQEQSSNLSIHDTSARDHDFLVDMTFNSLGKRKRLSNGDLGILPSKEARFSVSSDNVQNEEPNPVN